MTFPRDWKAFRKWREEQTFASVEQAERAVQVENHMRLLAQIDEENTPVPAVRAACEKTIREFEREMQG